MRAAGCVVNDLWDRRLDRQVERTASGRWQPAPSASCRHWSSLPSALSGLPCCCSSYGGGSRHRALPLVILYPLAKRVTWWPQAVLGLTFPWGVPLGGGRNALPSAELLVYAGSVAWVFGYDTIYAVQDMADDRVGVKSSALGLGRHLHAGVAPPTAGGRFWRRAVVAGRTDFGSRDLLRWPPTLAVKSGRRPPRDGAAPVQVQPRCRPLLAAGIVLDRLRLTVTARLRKS